MIIPEIIIYNTLVSFQSVTLTDYKSKTDKSKTILNQIFDKDDNNNPLLINTYNYLKQATSILTRDVENTKVLKFFMGYNPQRHAGPVVHILMPNENKGRMDTLGHSQHDEVSSEGDFVTIEKTRSNSSIYYLMITSDNSSEVQIIYYWLKAMFLLFHENFELLGLKNLSHSGQDINLQQEYAPPNIFHRNLSLAFDYESSVKMTVDNKIISDIKIGVCANFKEDFDDYMNTNNQQA